MARVSRQVFPGYLGSVPTPPFPRHSLSLSWIFPPSPILSDETLPENIGWLSIKYSFVLIDEAQLHVNNPNSFRKVEISGVVRLANLRSLKGFNKYLFKRTGWATLPVQFYWSPFNPPTSLCILEKIAFTQTSILKPWNPKTKEIGKFWKNNSLGNLENSKSL